MRTNTKLTSDSDASKIAAGCTYVVVALLFTAIRFFFFMWVILALNTLVAPPLPVFWMYFAAVILSLPRPAATVRRS